MGWSNGVLLKEVAVFQKCSPMVVSLYMVMEGRDGYNKVLI